MGQGRARVASSLRGVVLQQMPRVGVILVAFLSAGSPVPTGFSACTLLTLQEAKEILGPKAILHYDDKWRVVQSWPLGKLSPR